MYIRPKKVFWTLVLLAALLYAGAHLLVRTSWARAQILRGLSIRTGYAASASEIRFTPGLALSFKDFRLAQAATTGEVGRAVVEAPWLRVGRCRGGWAVRAPRARLAAYRENGVWTPSQATGAEECPGACVFPRISPALGSLWLDLADAQVSFVDGAETTAFAGVSWTRAPVRIPGRPGAVQNRLSWLKGPIRGDVTAEMAVRGSDEWYELPGGIARLATQGAPAAGRNPHAEPAENAEPASGGASSPSEPPAAPSGSPAGGAGERSEPEGVFSAEAGVIGGEDGPTSIWLSSKAENLPPKEDMVEMFREFFETDPETAKAFFEAADEARGAKETHAEPAENAEPASGGASSPIEPPPAPAEENPHAEPAENAEPASGGASSPSEPSPAEEKPNAPAS